MTRRLLRLASSIGDLGSILDGVRVRDGDVLVADATRVIAVEVLPDDVLVAYPRFDRAGGRDRARARQPAYPGHSRRRRDRGRVRRTARRAVRTRRRARTNAPRASWSDRSSTHTRRTRTADGRALSAALRQRVSERRVLAVVRFRDGDPRARTSPMRRPCAAGSATTSSTVWRRSTRARSCWACAARRASASSMRSSTAAVFARDVRAANRRLGARDLGGLSGHGHRRRRYRRLPRSDRERRRKRTARAGVHARLSRDRCSPSRMRCAAI